MRLSSLLVMMSFQEQMTNEQRQNVVKDILGKSHKSLNNRKMPIGLRHFRKLYSTFFAFSPLSKTAHF